MKKELTKRTKSASSDAEQKEIIIDMPEVKDIPGQENISPPKLKEMYDSTPSSSDEEGEGILDELNSDEDTDSSGDTNVSKLERKILDKTDRPENEESKDIKKLKLDSTDGEDKLNEGNDPLDLGEDLDLPGAELDDENEEIGEEDEENNSYSKPD